MEWKKRHMRCLALCVALAVLLVGQAWAAIPKQLIAGGHTVGIRMQTEGVVITGFDASGSAAEKAGLRAGDVIRMVNHTPVEDAAALRELLEESDGAATVEAERGDKTVEVLVQPQKDGEVRLGAYIRDSIAGIGNVTFYDPETGLYGALGHGISDQSTMTLLPLHEGTLVESSVVSVVQGQVGAPGQLQGAFDLRQTVGSVTANTERGIFGTMEQAPEGELMPVAENSEITTGPAIILSNVDGKQTQAYTVEISRLYPFSKDSRNLLLQVTDERLLEKTGGIVQGMSGSPILQNGKIVGAVTHVLVNDPTRGYGIFAENMLKAVYDAA